MNVVNHNAEWLLSMKSLSSRETFFTGTDCDVRPSPWKTGSSCEWKQTTHPEVGAALHVGRWDLLVDDGQVACKGGQSSLEVVTNSAAHMYGKNNHVAAQAWSSTARSCRQQTEKTRIYTWCCLSWSSTSKSCWQQMNKTKMFYSYLYTIRWCLSWSSTLRSCRQQTKSRNVLLPFIYIYDAVYHNPNLAGRKRQEFFAFLWSGRYIILSRSQSQWTKQPGKLP